MQSRRQPHPNIKTEHLCPIACIITIHLLTIINLALYHPQSNITIVLLIKLTLIITIPKDTTMISQTTTENTILDANGTEER